MVLLKDSIHLMSIVYTYFIYFVMHWSMSFIH